MDYAKMLADAETRMQALMEQTEKTEDVAELRSIYREMQTLRSNIEILKAVTLMSKKLNRRNRLRQLLLSMIVLSP